MKFRLITKSFVLYVAQLIKKYHLLLYNITHNNNNKTNNYIGPFLTVFCALLDLPNCEGPNPISFLQPEPPLPLRYPNCHHHYHTHVTVTTTIVLGVTRYYVPYEVTCMKTVFDRSPKDHSFQAFSLKKFTPWICHFGEIKNSLALVIKT